MTTTTTTDPYATVRESPAYTSLLAFQAGETRTFPQTGWEKPCAAQYARRDAERDARWTAMRAWLEHWAESARATMRGARKQRGQVLPGAVPDRPGRDDQAGAGVMTIRGAGIYGGNVAWAGHPVPAKPTARRQGNDRALGRGPRRRDQVLRNGRMGTATVLPQEELLAAGGLREPDDRRHQARHAQGPPYRRPPGHPGRLSPMPSFDNTETVATFQRDGKTYEIDHLGIGHDSQWGEFNVWTGGNCVAEFAIDEAMLKPECRPAELPVSTKELIRLARETLALDELEDILDA